MQVAPAFGEQVQEHAEVDRFAHSARSEHADESAGASRHMIDSITSAGAWQLPHGVPNDTRPSQSGQGGYDADKP